MNLQPKAFDKWAQFTKEYDEVPSYEVFQQFLKVQSSVTKNDRTGTSPIKSASATTSSVGVGGFKKKTQRASVFVANRTDNCDLCGKSHPLYLCTFQNTTLNQ